MADTPEETITQKNESGSPKTSRRNFLKMVGAGAATAFLGGSRVTTPELPKQDLTQNQQIVEGLRMAEKETNVDEFAEYILEITENNTLEGRINIAKTLTREEFLNLVISDSLLDEIVIGSIPENGPALANMRIVRAGSDLPMLNFEDTRSLPVSLLRLSEEQSGVYYIDLASSAPASLREAVSSKHSEKISERVFGFEEEQIFDRYSVNPRELIDVLVGVSTEAPNMVLGHEINEDSSFSIRAYAPDIDVKSAYGINDLKQYFDHRYFEIMNYGSVDDRTRVQEGGPTPPQVNTSSSENILKDGGLVGHGDFKRMEVDFDVGFSKYRINSISYLNFYAQALSEARFGVIENAGMIAADVGSKSSVDMFLVDTEDAPLHQVNGVEKNYTEMAYQTLRVGLGSLSSANTYQRQNIA